jgi:hypothetical protein
VLPIRRAHKGVRTPAHTAWRAAPLARICGAEGATLARPLGARSLALPSAGRGASFPTVRNSRSLALPGGRACSLRAVRSWARCMPTVNRARQVDVVSSIDDSHPCCACP